jgi:hypothetical protein
MAFEYMKIPLSPGGSELFVIDKENRIYVHGVGESPDHEIEYYDLVIKDDVIRIYGNFDNYVADNKSWYSYMNVLWAEASKKCSISDEAITTYICQAFHEYGSAPEGTKFEKTKVTFDNDYVVSRKDRVERFRPLRAEFLEIMNKLGWK